MKYPCLVIQEEPGQYPLGVHEISDKENCDAEAESVWQARGCPEMWLFMEVGTAPRYIPAAPKESNEKHQLRRGSRSN